MLDSTRQQLVHLSDTGLKLVHAYESAVLNAARNAGKEDLDDRGGRARVSASG
jgi:hypothetical protein